MSLLDNIDVIAKTADSAAIIDFIHEHYHIADIYHINDIIRIHDNIVDIYGDIKILRFTAPESLTNGLFKFGTIHGCFDCSRCSGLKSLEGGPKEVTEDFNCYNCQALMTLEGGPQLVYGKFNCKNCGGIIDFKGAPKEVRDFDCSYCRNLETLEGAPEKVDRDFICFNCINLKSLKGGPKKIGGRIQINSCPKLEDGYMRYKDNIKYFQYKEMFSEEDL